MIYSKGCVESLTGNALTFRNTHKSLEDENGMFWGGFFSMKWDSYYENTRKEFHAQFTEDFEYYNPYKYCDYEEWLDGMLAEDDVGGLSYAKYLHTFAVPPNFSLPGLRYTPLDPQCPRLNNWPEMGYEAAVEWGRLSKEETLRLDKIHSMDLSRFVPKYILPWYGGATVTWDSHWGALYIYLMNNTPLTSALLGI